MYNVSGSFMTVPLIQKLVYLKTSAIILPGSWKAITAKIFFFSFKEMLLLGWLQLLSEPSTYSIETFLHHFPETALAVWWIGRFSIFFFKTSSKVEVQNILQLRMRWIFFRRDLFPIIHFCVHSVLYLSINKPLIKWPDKGRLQNEAQHTKNSIWNCLWTFFLSSLPKCGLNLKESAEVLINLCLFLLLFKHLT